MSGSAVNKPKNTSDREFSSVVYFGSSMVGDDPTYAIHSAAGVPMSLVENIEAATMLASDYGMADVAVHRL